MTVSRLPEVRQVKCITFTNFNNWNDVKYFRQAKPAATAYAQMTLILAKKRGMTDPQKLASLKKETFDKALLIFQKYFTEPINSEEPISI